MPGQETQVIVKMTDEEKAEWEAEAEKRDMTRSGYLREAEKFYRAFDPEFLKAVDKGAAGPLKMPISVVIVYLLNYYLAQESALIRFFGSTKTFERAFRYDSKKGLLPTDEIAELVEKEIKQKIEAILQKSQKAKRAGKKPDLTLDECAVLGARA